MNAVLTEELLQSLLPQTPSAFQQTSRKAFPRILLGRAAMLSQE
jgi:hypothetical protein